MSNGHSSVLALLSFAAHDTTDHFFKKKGVSYSSKGLKEKSWFHSHVAVVIISYWKEKAIQIQHKQIQIHIYLSFNV